MGSRPDIDGNPHLWLSFMTDDFTPVELSWCWKECRQLPVVRYAIEPIGHWAGTSCDPLNLQSAKDFIYRARSSLSGLNFHLMDIFSRALLLPNPDVLNSRVASSSDGSEGSQMFLAYDLKENGKTTLKAYFIPTLKAMSLGKPKLHLVQTAMDELSDSQPQMRTAFNIVTEYVGSRSSEQQLETEIVAIDCVEPSASRVKIYVRCRLTSFDSVTDIMTMGGTLDTPSMQTALRSLKKLWGQVLGLDDDFSNSMSLLSNGHRTAGILYYFELKPGARLPSVKVYIPVKHYGINDLEVAKGLSSYLKSRGNGFADDDYLGAMQSMW